MPIEGWCGLREKLFFKVPITITATSEKDRKMYCASSKTKK
jgi:hypothetical protein